MAKLQMRMLREVQTITRRLIREACFGENQSRASDAMLVRVQQK